jgi:hypothetical protein
MDVRFRPIALWPHPDTSPRRGRYTFKAPWSDTLDLLERELDHLDASDVIIGCGLRETDIRMDGWPRAGARVPDHPGVELSFSSPVAAHRLVYATDSCERWEHNVRSIALGLEALRAVDRYGITQDNQQYAGFKALPVGPDDPSVARGMELIREHGGVVREALMASHPDHGGNSRDFISVRLAQPSMG